ncbi:MAG TPA: histidine kinase dimerization/phosphoacceptor domain -containing protein [Microvirga sp.]
MTVLENLVGTRYKGRHVPAQASWMIPVRDVRTVLYATALLFALAIIGTRGVFLWFEHRYAIERAEAATRDLALLMEEYTKRTLETSDLLLRDIITTVQERGGVGAVTGSREVHDYLVDLTRRSSAGDFFLVVDRQGVPAALTASHPPPRISLGDQRWFRAHVAGAETVVGGALVGRITGEILFTYTRRIPASDGGFDGAAQVALRSTFLQEVSRSNDDTRDILLGIWARDGGVIARTDLKPDQVNATIGNSPLFSEFLSQRVGTFRSTAVFDGVDQIVSFRRLERWPVTVTASLPVSTALAAWTEGLYWSAAVIAVVLVALAWLTWIGVRLSYRTEDAQRRLQAVNAELADTNKSLETALSDKVVLLQEIHHRVKNNLQVTSSLLQMQARRFDDPDVRIAFQETQDRLRSIGLIHDTLYRTDAGGTIHLQDYLSRLIGELSGAYGAAARGITVDLDAEPIAIDLNRAVPLALAVTEAISNAFKHAFVPGEGGRIKVRARQLGDAIEVEVRDTGRGVAGPIEKDSSLGTKLMRAFATQLGGRFSLENDGGTVFRLTVPA